MDREPDYAAEDAAIRLFYHVDSFDDEVWVDEVSGADRSHPETTAEQFSRVGDGPPERDARLHFAEDEIDLQAQDDGDPLEIHSSKEMQDVMSNMSNAQVREKPALNIYNKSFQPRQFLLQVHKDTSYKGLIQGKKNLRAKVDQHARALQALVHANFDRFVSAKDTIDHVYEEMKSKQLNEEQAYGTRGVQLALQDANARANLIYGPIVDRRQKGEKVRSTLTILQRYKFFFGLPSSLLESIKQNKYETAIRDYKRGKEVHLGPTGSEDPDAVTSDLNRKVFDKVWAEVTKIVEELQNVLFKMLADPWRGMDEQINTIKFLYDLDTTKDPAWFYLDSKHKWIMDLMEKTYQTGVDKVKRLVPKRESLSEAQRSITLKQALDQIHPDMKDFSDQDQDLLTWRATLDLVKAMSSLLLRCLVDFWRLSEALIGERFSKKASQPSLTMTPGESRRRKGMNLDMDNVTKCRNMSSDIVKLYVEKMSSHFSLDMLRPIDPLEYCALAKLPEFLPCNTNSVHASLYLKRILIELETCVKDVNGVKLNGEKVTQSLRALLWRTGDMFIRVLCTCWERDARSFNRLEEWVVDLAKPDRTMILQRFYDFQETCSRSVCTMIDLLTETNPSESSDDFIDLAHESFCSTIFSFLECLLALPFNEYIPLNDKDELLLAKKRGKIDVRSHDVRTLLTIRNLTLLRKSIIRKLFDVFEDACHITMDDNYQLMDGRMEEIDAQLFQSYTTRKSGEIRDIIRQGIQSSGIDWYSISKPKAVHSFVYEALMKFVLVHSQTSNVDKALSHRVLSQMLETVVNDCLDSFQTVKRFGMGGMLQATLEIEFMHQTLSQYVNKTAEDGLQEIYKTIEQKYDQQNQSSNSLQSELKHVKELLVYSRKSTIVQFLCFKKPKRSVRPS